MKYLSDIVKENGEKCLFPSLPIEAKKSIIQFYFIECESMFAIEEHPLFNLKPHNEDGSIDWDNLIPAFDSYYSNDSYSFYNMPTNVLKAFLMSDACEFKDEFDSFQDYHNAYCEQNEADHSHLNRWPSIAECEEEGIIDGWHRFHDYVRKGHDTIPLVSSDFII